MAQRKRKEIRDRDLCGLKYFKVLDPLLRRLHDDATARDRAGNRHLHYDQYALLLLLFYFNPIVTRLRGIQQASMLKRVQKLLGCERTSLGSLSEASSVFDAGRLREIIGELAAQALPVVVGREAEALRGLTAGDGSLLPALPRMFWALFQDDTHRAAKMHVQFDVLKGVPCDATVTAANVAEHRELQAMLAPGRFYVLDRGYAAYEFLQAIVAQKSSFVCRLKESAAFQVVEERPVPAAAHAAGVRRDAIVWLGGNGHYQLEQPVRLVWVHTGKMGKDGTPEVLLLVTDRLDLDADLVALAYRYRWSIELFFRWLKCTLGCRHLLSHSRNGVTIQVYLGLIASLLIGVWTGKKPTKRTWEMLQFYFTGWATEDELMTHILHLPDAD